VKNVAAFTALALLCVAAHAEELTPFAKDLVTRLANQRDQMVVFGFELGRPLVLPECKYEPLYPGSKTKRYDIVQPVTCSKEDLTNYAGWPVRRVQFTSAETSSIAPYGFTTLEKDGLLLGMEFGTRGIELQNYILRQLTEKFGKPTSLSTESVGNKFGARFEAVTAIWSGGAIDVSYFAAAGRLDEGHVIISLPEGTAIRAGWKAQPLPSERRL
jgi:hypothetical protein